MTYHGRIYNGGVVLDEPVQLPEGSEVECEVVALEAREKPNNQSFYNEFKEFAGCIDDAPADASQNLDEYLYGKPKR